eukprot:1161900-Karenia_brevis.AAC.1
MALVNADVCSSYFGLLLASHWPTCWPGYADGGAALFVISITMFESVIDLRDPPVPVDSYNSDDDGA